jgi:hypothetical protein
MCGVTYQNVGSDWNVDLFASIEATTSHLETLHRQVLISTDSSF